MDELSGATFIPCPAFLEREMRLCVIVVAILSFNTVTAWGQPNPKLSAQLAEARGHIEAAGALLESMHPYDVVVSIEQSIDVDELIIPATKSKWRVRVNKDESTCLYAVDNRYISFDDAFAGRLDNWSSHSFLKEIEGKAVAETGLDRATQRRRVKEFGQGLITEMIPDVPQCLHGQFLSGAANPSTFKEKIPRIYSMADECVVREAVFDDDPVVDVQVILKDQRVTEVHRWLYSADTLEPRLHQILQSPAGSPTTNSLYRHTLKWTDDENYGRVPVVSRAVENVRMILKEKDGGTKRIKCKRYTDIKFTWKKVDEKKLKVVDANGHMSVEKFESLFK